MATPQLYYKDGGSWKSAMLNSYPVGAIYSSTSSTNPGSIFGGGWVQITGDACLMASNGVGNVGSKKITTNNLPAHNHSVWMNSAGAHSHRNTVWGLSSDEVANYGLTYGAGSGFVNRVVISLSKQAKSGLWTSNTGGHTHSAGTNNTGSGQDYLPYGYRCYMWKRTS